MTGTADGIACLPDSVLARTAQLTPAEEAVRHGVVSRWPGAHAVAARFSEPLDALADAEKTGRLTIRPDAVVRAITIDDAGRVSGVEWIDASTGRVERSQAPIVMLCASALESTRLLLLSRSPRHPNGIGAGSGVLGRFLMDHIKMAAHGRGPVLAPAQVGSPCRHRNTWPSRAPSSR